MNTGKKQIGPRRQGKRLARTDDMYIINAANPETLVAGITGSRRLSTALGGSIERGGVCTEV